MKSKFKPIILFFVFVLLLAGCSVNSDSGENKNNNTNNNGSSSTVDMSFVQTTADMFTDRDSRTTYQENSAIFIQLNGNSVTCDSGKVQVSGSTITLTDEGTYVFSGTLTDGMIIVEAEETDKLQLVFNNVSIQSKTSAPLYVLKADKVFVTLATDSTNTLSNGGTFTAIDDNNIDATVFSKEDLTFNGSGTLTVTTPAGHAIVCKDDLVFTGGTYHITSSSHGLDANDSIRIINASFTIDSGKDGIHAENNDDENSGFIYIAGGSFQISSEGDGISAASFLQIEDGTFFILSGGGSVNSSKESSDFWGGFMGQPGKPSSSTTTTDSTSMKALKASGNLLIKNGTFSIDSADDAIHTNTSVIINGGSFEIATGDDGFHGDETLKITAGTIVITESYEGLEALHIEISGGDIRLAASDDGLNAAGGTDGSGTSGGRDGMFGGGPGGGMGGPGGGMGGSSNGSITISGGTLYINASGDGIDANGTLTISGGHTTVCGPTRGDTATLDYDKSATISGGTFIGTGASGMAQTFSNSTQGVYAVRVGNQAAGTTITLKDSEGNVVISHEPALDFAVVILSSPDIIKGKTYTITAGSATGEFEAQ